MLSVATLRHADFGGCGGCWSTEFNEMCACCLGEAGVLDKVTGVVVKNAGLIYSVRTGC